jgi:hypothetical protein
MVLAAFGTDSEEGDREKQARLEIDGTGIGELERLARLFGLVAHVQEATVEQLRQLLAEGKLAIAYIDRAVFELPPRQRAGRTLREARIHTVIPTRVTASAVTYHDPLPPARIIRRSMRLFQSAYERLGSNCVVCYKTASE